MSKQATLTVRYELVGDGDLVENAAQYITANAAGMQPLQLNAGDNTIQVPSGLTVTCVALRPPTGSANAKSVKAVAGDSNPQNWTNQPIVYAVTAGGTFVIHSVGSETLDAWYA